VLFHVPNTLAYLQQNVPTPPTYFDRSHFTNPSYCTDHGSDYTQEVNLCHALQLNICQSTLFSWHIVTYDSVIYPQISHQNSSSKKKKTLPTRKSSILDSIWLPTAKIQAILSLGHSWNASLSSEASFHSTCQGISLLSLQLHCQTQY
jgi:hypothetical protein